MKLAGETKMEGACSFKTLVDFQLTTKRLAHTYFCENLKSYIHTSVLFVNDMSIKITELDLNNHVEVKKVKMSLCLITSAL
jgi:hypothetical protein